ncbi:MAG: LssY C-terminal domain-containing protein [Brooklawnia sp.]|jgi:hypothetical protein
MRGKTPERLPNKVRQPVHQHRRQGLIVENLFFALATVSTALLAAVVLRASWHTARGEAIGREAAGLLAYLIVFWAVLAYLTLPRIHRILTAIYVPDYYIGRSRTSDGLLGDPINLALKGNADQIHHAMRAAGWTRADPINLGSAIRMISASLRARSYPEAPVSPLMVFGRTQAFAYQQEVEGNPAQRHHVRFWPTPDGWLLPGGRRVDWLAAGTYDRSVGLSLFTLQITHKIDADIDTERDHITSGVIETVPEARVEVLVDFTTGYHGRNGGGDTIHTDGDMPILDLRQVPARQFHGATRVQRAPTDDLAASSTAVLAHLGRRPVAVGLASLLVVIVVATSLAVLSQQGAFMLPADASPQLEQWWDPLVVGLTVAGAAVVLLLAWFIHQGHNWARLLMLLVISISLGSEFGRSLTGQVPGIVTLLNMTVEILILYALTTASAREWTHQAGRHRQVRRALARQFRRTRAD